jgi:hypothetical protein
VAEDRNSTFKYNTIHRSVMYVRQLVRCYTSLDDGTVEKVRILSNAFKYHKIN